MRKLKNRIESDSFNDGFVWVMPYTDDGEPDRGKALRLHFGNRSLSFKRILEAKQIQADISRVIAVPIPFPMADRLRACKCADIGGKVYRIEIIQEIISAVPPTAVLSLSEWSAVIG